MLHSTSRLSLASSHFQPLLVCVFVSSVCVYATERERGRVFCIGVDRQTLYSHSMSKSGAMWYRQHKHIQGLFAALLTR